MASFKQTLKGLKSQMFSSHQNPILHNRWVLYFIFFISLANLFYLSVEGDFTTIAIFILVGFLTSFFSKNMLIILFIALAISNVLKVGTKITKEGFKESDKKTNKIQTLPKMEDKKKVADKKKTDKKENFELENSSTKRNKPLTTDQKKQILADKQSKLTDKQNKLSKLSQDSTKTEKQKERTAKLSQNTQKLKDKISNLMSKFNLS